MARVLAADADVLLRLSSSTDPEVATFLYGRPKLVQLIRYIMANNIPDTKIDEILMDFGTAAKRRQSIRLAIIDLEHRMGIPTLDSDTVPGFPGREVSNSPLLN